MGVLHLDHSLPQTDQIGSDSYSSTRHLCVSQGENQKDLALSVLQEESDTRPPHHTDGDDFFVGLRRFPRDSAWTSQVLNTKIFVFPNDVSDNVSVMRKAN